MSSRFTTGPHRLALMSCAVMFLTACAPGGSGPDANASTNDSNGVSANGEKMTNVPGAVTESPPGSRNLTGHYEIRLAGPGDAFIFSSGGGGACLVTQYPAVPKRCNRHSECALPSANMGANAGSYCLPDNAGTVPPGGAGTCWIKPSDDFCLTRVGLGQHDIAPQDTTALAAAGMKKWRVLSCLNGPPHTCGTGPPTPNQVQHRVGDVYIAP